MTLDEIKRKRNKWMLPGILLSPALLIFILGVFLSFGAWGVIAILVGFFVSMSVMFVGLALILMSITWRRYFIYAQVLQKFFEPPVTITKEYVAAKDGNTYVFAWNGDEYGLFFVALKQSSIVPAEKIRRPPIYRSVWDYKSALNFEGGLSVNRAEGTFSTPTPEGNIISGDGIWLCMPHTRYNRAHLTKENLHQVAEYAEKCLSEKPDEGLNSPDE